MNALLAFVISFGTEKGSDLLVSHTCEAKRAKHHCVLDPLQMMTVLFDWFRPQVLTQVLLKIPSPLLSYTASYFKEKDK